MNVQGYYISLLISAAILSSSSHAEDAEPEPVYANVEMEGKPYGGENCEGGDWSLNWKGPVHVETGPLADLLISYTAFDTSHQGQRPIPPVKFNSTKVICRDDDGKVVMTAQISNKNSNVVQLTTSLTQNAAMRSPAFIFSASELGDCKVNASSMSFEYPNIMASIHTGAYNSLSPALDITLEDLQKGFNKTYNFDGTVIGIAPMCMGGELKRGTVNLRYKSSAEDPEVVLDACLHLAKNETREIVATGSPVGGEYQFSASPPDVLNIAHQQKNTASILGKTPGKGNVTVEYTRNGKTATATVAGSVVELVSINSGSAVPKLGLYDADGKKIQTLYSFPLTLKPIDGFVQTTLENDTLASVVNTSSSVQIQPVKTGKSVLQTKTLCGSKIGEPIPIEIVRCDDEVQEKLRVKKEELKQRTDAIVGRITRLTGDSEFQRAATEIKATTTDMAIKTGESIINTLTFGETQHVKFATSKGIQLSKQITVNAQRLDVAGTVWDSGNSIYDAYTAFSEPPDVNSHIKYMVGAAVLGAQNSAIALGKTYGEAYLAADKFGKDLGLISGVAEQLAELTPQHDKLIKEYVGIHDRLVFCEKSPPPTPEPQPPQPQPIPENDQDIPAEELPPEDIPVDEETVEEEPVPEEPEPTPPSEQPPRKVYGLACRIQDLKAPGLAQHLRELKQLAQAQQQKLLQAKIDLQQWQTAIETMKTKNEGTDTERAAEFKKFKQAHNQFLLKSAQYGFDSLDYMMETEECPERLEIKIDQVRTRYN